MTGVPVPQLGLGSETVDGSGMAVLEKLERLLKQGAVAIGPKPKMLVSLVGGAEAQNRFKALSDNIWGEEAWDNGVMAYGKGTIAFGTTARAFLMSNGVPADFGILGNDSKTDFDYIHYTIGQRRGLPIVLDGQQMNPARLS